MTRITYFSTNPTKNDLPELFLSPFNNKPHLLALKASQELQNWLTTQTHLKHHFENPDGGKMFGVLVVKDTDNRVGYLSAFSGMLENKWELDKFVPPIFDQSEIKSFLPDGEKQLSIYTHKIASLENNEEYRELKIKFQNLTQQRDEQLLILNNKHCLNKQSRKKQRLSLNKTDQHVILAKLSFDSQEDKREKKLAMLQWQKTLNLTSSLIEKIEQKITLLKNLRTELSKNLHKQVFSNYTLVNKLQEQEKISRFFENSQPPGGTGDCAAPKLIQYAHLNNLTPLAIAEFWWGASPSSEIRHHGHFYPACRGKCHPILPFMLKGLNVQEWETPEKHSLKIKKLEVIYEDDALLVINKPHGLLSIPGIETQDSVYTRIKADYPDATGPLLVHRLDLDTSGLLLIAKTSEIHKKLQQQFIQRTIEKRYVAILSKSIPNKESKNIKKGIIELPLRVDLNDRPRQMVCNDHGKPAKTLWEIIDHTSETTRLFLYPYTGRTHQLRVHMAHIRGLDAPILGDKLYGKEADRLYLHAEQLCFYHPVSGTKIVVNSKSPF